MNVAIHTIGVNLPASLRICAEYRWTSLSGRLPFTPRQNTDRCRTAELKSFRSFGWKSLMSLTGTDARTPSLINWTYFPDVCATKRNNFRQNKLNFSPQIRPTPWRQLQTSGKGRYSGERDDFLKYIVRDYHYIPMNFFSIFWQLFICFDWEIIVLTIFKALAANLIILLFLICNITLKTAAL